MLAEVERAEEIRRNAVRERIITFGLVPFWAATSTKSAANARRTFMIAVLDKKAPDPYRCYM